jgi:hypothetical protein
LRSQGAGLDQRIDRGRRHENHVGLFAGGELFLNLADHGIGVIHLVAGLLLELRRQDEQRFFRRTAAVDLDVRAHSYLHACHRSPARPQ